MGAVFGGLTAASLFCTVFGEEERARRYTEAGAQIRDAASRYLWREELHRFARGGRPKKYDYAIERKGFATVLYLRLIYFPFTAVNFGMGLTRVRFWDYFSGTALGIIAGTFIFTFFVGTVKEVRSSGHWGGLFSWKVFSSLGLFVFSFFIPKIVERLKASQKVGVV